MRDDDDDFEAPRTARRMTLLEAVAWSAALSIVTTVLVQITESARPGASLDLVNITVCTVVALSIFLFAMLRVYAPESSIRDVLGMRAVSPIAAGLAIAIGVLISPGLSLVDDAHQPFCRHRSSALADHGAQPLGIVDFSFIRPGSQTQPAARSHTAAA